MKHQQPTSPKGETSHHLISLLSLAENKVKVNPPIFFDIIFSQEWSMSNKISLKKYFKSKFRAIEKATQVAHEEMNRRLDGMNEFRKQLDRQADDFFSRSEHELFRSKIEEDIQGLREFRSEMQGKASQSSVVLSTLIAIGGLLLAAISIVLGFFGK